MKLANRIENSVIALCTVVLTVLLMNFLVIKPMRADFRKQSQAQNELILHLAQIEKIKIENDFGKMKPRDSQIIIDLDSKINNLAKMDTIRPTPKKGFWRRLFQ